MRKQKRREKVRKNPIKAGLGWLFQIIVVILFAYIAVFFSVSPERTSDRR